MYVRRAAGYGHNIEVAEVRQSKKEVAVSAGITTRDAGEQVKGIAVIAASTYRVDGEHASDIAVSAGIASCDMYVQAIALADFAGV
jgi:hypothetical protein